MIFHQVIIEILGGSTTDRRPISHMDTRGAERLARQPEGALRFSRMDDHRLSSYDTPARRARFQAEATPEPWPARTVTILGLIIVGLIIGGILGIALR